MNYKIVTGRENPEIRKLQSDLILSAWPEFMLHDIYIDKYWDNIVRRYPEYQFILLEKQTDEIIAIGNSMPVRFDDSIDHLPDGGIDWALETCHRQINSGEKPNLLCAFQIVVSKDHLGSGLSYQAVKAMVAIGQRSGLNHLIAPVRPNLKNQYPLTPMERYINWTNGKNLPFDGWLRVHRKLGAKLINICPESMLITGSVADWESWTKMKFPDSGDYIIPGALVPIQIDRENDIGRYIEPNVWMVHNLKDSG